MKTVLPAFWVIKTIFDQFWSIKTDFDLILCLEPVLTTVFVKTSFGWSKLHFCLYLIYINFTKGRCILDSQIYVPLSEVFIYIVFEIILLGTLSYDLFKKDIILVYIFCWTIISVTFFSFIFIWYQDLVNLKFRDLSNSKLILGEALQCCKKFFSSGGGRALLFLTFFLNLYTI